MFDLSIWEIAIVAVVAILVVGPRELPRALATAGKWLRKFRTISNSLRSGLDDIIRETEMTEMEEKWAQQNKQIMAQHPNEMLPIAPDGLKYDDDYDDDEIGGTVEIKEDSTASSIKPTVKTEKSAKTKPNPKAKTNSQTKSMKTSQSKRNKPSRTNAAKPSNANKAKSVKVKKTKGGQ